jgi:CBS domain containing-hemolysin-like protein
MGNLWFDITIIVLLIVANGFFVAAEFAIAGAQRARVAQLADAGSRPAQHILDVITNPDHMNRYISTAQVGITLASLGLGMYSEHAVAGYLIGPLERLGGLGEAAAHTIAAVIAVALLTYLHVVVGEMVPKTLALQAPSNAAVALSAIMVAAEIVFRPLTRLLIWIGNAVLRAAGLPQAAAGERLVSSSDLEYIVVESSEVGLLEPAEQVFLSNVIDFHERSVGQVMTPRTRMVALPVDFDITQALTVIAEERHSRYPVYEKDRDHIVGILHTKDLARRLLLEPNGDFQLRDILREPVFVPENLALDMMLARFQAEHVQIAVVLDEFGGTAGIVTLEDLAEEIIGEIRDEFDEEIDPFVRIAPDTLRVRGDLLLDELNQHFDLHLDDDEAETVGGLVMTHLGHIAQPGDSVTVNNVTLAVESVEGLAVSTVLLTLPSAPEQSADAPHPSEAK